jgi:hypothetical protein
MEKYSIKLIPHKCEKCNNLSSFYYTLKDAINNIRDICPICMKSLVEQNEKIIIEGDKIITLKDNILIA